MSELVERVARAICETGNVPGFKCACPTRQDGWCLGGRLEKQARAAIAAVRDHDEILVRYAGHDGRRDWQTTGAWLYPGQAISVIDLDDPPPRDPAQGNPSGHIQE